jgi:hypothetical protein
VSQISNDPHTTVAAPCNDGLSDNDKGRNEESSVDERSGKGLMPKHCWKEFVEGEENAREGNEGNRNTPVFTHFKAEDAANHVKAPKENREACGGGLNLFGSGRRGRESMGSDSKKEDAQDD